MPVVNRALNKIDNFPIARPDGRPVLVRLVQRRTASRRRTRSPPQIDDPALRNETLRAACRQRPRQYGPRGPRRSQPALMMN